MTTSIQAQEKLLDLDQAAELLDVSVTTLRRWIKARQIGATKVGGRWKLSQAAVNRYLDQRTIKPVAQPEA